MYWIENVSEGERRDEVGWGDISSEVAFWRVVKGFSGRRAPQPFTRNILLHSGTRGWGGVRVLCRYGLHFACAWLDTTTRQTRAAALSSTSELAASSKVGGLVEDFVLRHRPIVRKTDASAYVLYPRPKSGDDPIGEPSPGLQLVDANTESCLLA